MDRAVDALEAVLSGNRVREKIWSWLRSRPTQRLRRDRCAGLTGVRAPRRRYITAPSCQGTNSFCP